MLRIALLFITALVLLSGCSARTRYTIQVNVLSFIPEDQRGVNLPSGQFSAYIPNSVEGLLVPLPSVREIQNALEGAKIDVGGTLRNTGSTSLSVSYEIRLAPESDRNLTDGQWDFVPGGGSGSLNLGAGQEGVLSLEVTLDSTQNPEAFNLIRSGSFRILLWIEYNGKAGRLDLNKAEVSLTVRPFGLLE